MRAVRRYVLPVGTLVALSVAVGAAAVTIPVLTAQPLLALPSAVHLPLGIPPLRATPLGGSTWMYWFFDIAGVAVMLALALGRLARSYERRPDRGRGRTFAAAMWATAVGVIAGNTVRFVGMTIVTQMGPAAFAGFLIANVAVSLLLGLAAGVVVGAVAAVAHVRPSTAQPDSADPSTGHPSDAAAVVG